MREPLPDTQLAEARREGVATGREHVGASPSTLARRAAAREVRARINQLHRSFRLLYRRLRAETQNSERPGSVGDRGWLLENDHVIGRALDGCAEALQPGFCRRLAHLGAGEDQAVALRVDALARDRIEACQGRVDLDDLRAFVEGYQEVHSLSLGELWALPSFLSLALLEWLDREVVRIEDGVSGGELSARSGGRIGSAILSLRLLAAEDWRSFVETLSAVEEILRTDPAEVYPGMDFRTRDGYRHAVEKVALERGIQEPEVALKAVELAESAEPGRREGHVGFYLVGEGVGELHRVLGGRAPWHAEPVRRRKVLGTAYFGAVALMAIAVVLGIFLWAPSGLSAVLLALAAAGPALGVGVAVVNWLASRILPVRPLPRMDYRRGIPPQAATLVAVPMMFTSERDIREVIHTLEVNYQANSDPRLTFALVSDFVDAPRAHMPEDAELLEVARREVRRLNGRYGGVRRGAPFVLLHRGRRWNESEGCWMGWERKRGKLQQLNALLLGQPSELWVAAGNRSRLTEIPFVVTLDADTLMPRGAAARLIGTLAHPLNRPRIESDRSVSTGFTVLQPRIEILPEHGGRTPFYRIFGGVQGLDLYAHAAFDAYQDVFGEGIFAGKGIYDVAAFEACLHARVPENRILSHDLFEGAHGRAGFVADVILLEDFPVHPVAHSRRAHRWVRGDWQLLPWLGRGAPAHDERRGPHPLSALSRWKIFDNLRRSLQPPALLAFLFLAWVLYPEGARAAVWMVLGVVSLPFVLTLADALLRALHQPPSPGDLAAELRSLWRAGARAVLELAFLPHEVRTNLDAVIRTLDRLYRTRRRLLEWRTAAAVARSMEGQGAFQEAAKAMWVGPLLGVGAGVLLFNLPGAVLSAAVLVTLLLWLLSPLLAALIAWDPGGRPAEGRGEFPEAEARLLARRTWGYFERFQGPSTHWLPPDNYQEDPNDEVAERTSPTNVGMGMIASVVAWDLGFIGAPHLVARTGNTLRTLSALPRHRGHFLNWYDTRKLQPLAPLYVSTVDSGNLAAALVVLREALREARCTRLRPRLRARGMGETIRVLARVVQEGPENGIREELLGEVRLLERWCTEHLDRGFEEGPNIGGGDPERWYAQLEELRYTHLPRLEERVLGVTEGPAPEPRGLDSVVTWIGHLRGEVDQVLSEFELFMPWVPIAVSAGTPLEGGVRDLLHAFEPLPTLEELPGRLGELEEGFMALPMGDRRESLMQSVARSRETAEILVQDLGRIETVLEKRFDEMDFSFLYDRRRDLFRIGYSLTEGELDPNHYDLLASEARIASVVAITKGDVPLRHWLHLGRPFGRSAKGPVLLSWAGTMFEYLLPALFLRTPPESLLNDALSRAVRVQQLFGKRAGVPWGISESGYRVLDHQGHYQYHAFGVSDLAIRRDRAERLVTAPYASLMSVSWAPGAVRQNLEELEALGAMGPWGLYEAIDFGGSRTGESTPVVVRSYMSHHQGMIMAALGNHITGDRLIDRMHRDPRMQTMEPFLHERIPWRRRTGLTLLGADGAKKPESDRPLAPPWSPDPDRLPPPVHLLSNGSYSVRLGPSGEGGSRWNSWSIVRGGLGAGDLSGGTLLVLRDLDSGRSWLPLPEPGTSATGEQRLNFSAHMAEYLRVANGIRMRMTVTVAPREDVEVRQIRLVNESGERRRLRLAVALGVALAPPDDDVRHPAFHKLFVRARALGGGEGILFERRPRSPEEEPPVLGVALYSESGSPLRARWEVDRDRFIGRGGSPDRPRALDKGLDEPDAAAPSSAGFHPIDPIAGAVVELELEPWQEESMTLLLTVGTDPAEVERRVRDLSREGRRVWFQLQARSRAEGELLSLGATPHDLPMWEELLAHVLQPRGVRRAALDPRTPRDLGMPRLWRWGISGDIPFILLPFDTEEGTELLEAVLRAQAFWRSRGVRVDVVVRDAQPAGYQDPVRSLVRGILDDVHAVEIGVKGGLHILPSGELEADERDTLSLMAAVELDTSRGGLRGNLEHLRSLVRPLIPPPAPLVSIPAEAENLVDDLPDADEATELELRSEHGGFDPESGEYVIELAPGETTPAPWSNVVARGDTGFLITESGGGFTWSADAGEFRLTPWANDPVLDTPGEVLYLRDEATGRVWTPTPRPLGERRPHRIRHGWGASVLETRSQAFEEEVRWSIHPEVDVKVVRLRIRNRTDQTRRVLASYFADWVLGTDRSRTSPHLVARWDEELGAVVARNPFITRFGSRVAFLASDRTPDGSWVDREEFLGRAGRVDRLPAGLERGRLGEGRRTQGEPCGVVQTMLVLGPGETGEVRFLLGAAPDLDELVRRVGVARASGGGRGNKAGVGARGEAGGGAGIEAGVDSGVEARGATEPEWTDLLSRLQVRTPEPGLNRMMNGWLPYQTISARLRGRTGFYQSGGAFGFRDQLQDVYTLLPLAPELALAQLEEAARHQFEEGDVLHWWHPGTNRGVRTRCSDDLLWLPFVLAGTVLWTGDRTLLERRVSWLQADPLREGEAERYDEFGNAGGEGTLWEHALRAIDFALGRLGSRGLPLIGTGDWNDGMDRVGRAGRGESVWLAWFMIRVLSDIAEVARMKDEGELAARFESDRERLREAVERHGWDGEWYRRAFFDDGTPLGSRLAAEARIDSIAQSWSVLSGGANTDRTRQALDSAWTHLVRPEEGLSLLLTPPFDGAGPHPGYIAAYPPGVRENGGQYTHAAAWLISALARVGDGARAGQLLRRVLPFSHAAGREGTRRYRVEPYVVAADVYGAPPHTGRGGWTWYTGSAGWIYRVTFEDVLGIRRRGEHLVIAPSIPPDWPGFEVEWEAGGARVHLRVENPRGVSGGIARCRVNGEEADPSRITLLREGALRIEIVLGE